MMPRRAAFLPALPPAAAYARYFFFRRRMRPRFAAQRYEARLLTELATGRDSFRHY